MSGYPIRSVVYEEGQNPDFDTVDSCVPCSVTLSATGDDLLVTGPCRIVGYVVHVATASDVITLEDGLTNAGTVRVTIPASTAVGVYHFGGVGIPCDTGLFIDFTGTGTIAVLVQLASGSVLEA